MYVCINVHLSVYVYMYVCICRSTIQMIMEKIKMVVSRFYSIFQDTIPLIRPPCIDGCRPLFFLTVAQFDMPFPDDHRCCF